jgi:putative FmdB family regulatory protein
MPTYEYACKSCGEHLEKVQSFTDDALTTCPACGGSLRKVFGNIGISFKGSGFYKNDSRSASSSTTPAANATNGKESSGSESAASKGSSSDGSAGSGDAKPSGSKDTKSSGDSTSKDSGSKDSGSKDSGRSKQPAAAGTKGTP